MIKMQNLTKLTSLCFRKLQAKQEKRYLCRMYIFLDIDGVLVPARSWQQPKIMNDGFFEFSVPALRVLKTIITKETTIVLTSTHRTRFSNETWRQLFNNRGVVVKSVLQTPPNLNHLSRKEELLNWFQLNDSSSSFVIIDDDPSLRELPKHLRKHLISPASTVGLMDSHLGELEAILTYSSVLA